MRRAKLRFGTRSAPARNWPESGLLAVKRALDGLRSGHNGEHTSHHDEGAAYDSPSAIDTLSFLTLPSRSLGNCEESYDVCTWIFY